MTASTLITNYFGQGTHAARPTTPNVPSGATAFYYETDTSNTFVWSGVAWVQVNASSSTPGVPSVVQDAAAAGTAITGATLGAAPTSGNLLVAITGGGNFSAGTGWVKSPWIDANGTTWTNMFMKVAGTGESATQNPITSANAALVIYELSPGSILMPLCFFADGTNTSSTISAYALSTSGLIIGAVMTESATTYPTTVPGTTDAQANNTTANKAITGYHMTPTSSGATANSLTAAYAASTNFRFCALYVG
jgi:hypothetical protein